MGVRTFLESEDILAGPHFLRHLQRLFEGSDLVLRFRLELSLGSGQSGGVGGQAFSSDG